MEEEDAPGYVRLEKFLPIMTLAIMSKNYRPHTDDKIMKAFKVLDQENKGFLTQDVIKQFLVKEGKHKVCDVIFNYSNADCRHC